MNNVRLSGRVKSKPEFRVEGRIFAASVEIIVDRKGSVLKALALGEAAAKLKEFQPDDGIKVTGRLVVLPDSSLQILADVIETWEIIGPLDEPWSSGRGKDGTAGRLVLRGDAA